MLLASHGSFMVKTSFAKRYGARLAAGGTSNALEAGFGSIWGEDPRYYRAAGQPLRVRLGHVVRMAFVTHSRSGAQPAYARYLAVPGGVLVSNNWRPDSFHGAPCQYPGGHQFPEQDRQQCFFGVPSGSASSEK